MILTHLMPITLAVKLNAQQAEEPCEEAEAIDLAEVEMEECECGGLGEERDDDLLAETNLEAEPDLGLPCEDDLLAETDLEAEP